MKIVLIISSIVVILAFNACSAKEFNEGVESITGDVSEKFESGKDK